MCWAIRIKRVGSIDVIKNIFATFQSMSNPFDSPYSFKNVKCKAWPRLFRIRRKRHLALRLGGLIPAYETAVSLSYRVALT